MPELPTLPIDGAQLVDGTVTFDKLAPGITGMPVAIGTENAEGTAEALTRADHGHAHGAQELGDGTMHAEATTTVAGFMSAADKAKLDGLAGSGEVVDAGAGLIKTGTTLNVVAADASIVVGADSIAVGVLQTAAQHGDHGGGSLHAVATPSAAGFMSAADKTRLDAIVTGGEVAIPGAGLTQTGGVFDVVAADPSIVVLPDSIGVGVLQTDAMHGVRGGGTQHAVATALSAGFMSVADKTKLDSLGTGETVDAGAGLTKTGTTLDVVATDASIVVGADSIGVGVLQTDAMHGPRGGGALHPAATPTVDGFMSAADKAKLDGLGGPGEVVDAGAGLTKTGTTLDIVAADASIVVSADAISIGVLQTDAQHGDLGGGALHAAATPTVDGFMSAADKTKLDSLETGEVLTAGAGLTKTGTTLDVVAGDASIAVGPDSIAVGVLQTDGQHGDRGGGTQHAVATTAAAGFMSAIDKSRLDSLVASPGGEILDAGAGLTKTGTTLDVVATDASIVVLPDSIGVGVLQTDVQHGDRGGGSQHAAATTTVDGFMSAADKAKLDSLGTGEIVDAGAGLAKTGSTIDVVAADPSIVVGADSIGVGVLQTDAMHGTRGGGTQHALVTSTEDGFMSAADKVRLDGLTAGEIVDAGAGLAKTGSTLDVVAADASIVVGADSIAVGVLQNDAMHGVRGGGTQHAVATTSVAGFMSAADKAQHDANTTKLAGITAGAEVVTAGAGLTKTGSTLNAVAADASIVVGADSIGVGVLQSDAMHGMRGGGTQHAVATASAPGFMSAADKSAHDANTTKLAGIEAGSDNTLAGAGLTKTGSTIDVVAADASIVVGANSVGVGVLQSDAMHGVRGGGTQHAVATTSVNGFMSAADKTQHDANTTKLAGIAAGAEVVIAGAGLTKTGSTINAVAADASIVVNADSIGVGILQTDAQHGARSGGTLHAVATTSVAGFMSAADKSAHDANTTKLAGIAAGAEVVTAGAGLTKTGSTINAVAADASIVVGADAIGVGVLQTDAMHGVRGGGTQHAAVTTSVNGFMLAADKVRIDSMAPGSAAALGSVTVDAVFEAPSAVAYAATVSLDTSIKNDFVVGVLTGSITIRLTNATAGRQGSVMVKQDGTGTRGVTWQSDFSTYTVMMDSALLDLQPSMQPNSLTLYTYSLHTFAGANIVFINKITMVNAP